MPFIVLFGNPFYLESPLAVIFFQYLFLMFFFFFLTLRTWSNMKFIWLFGVRWISSFIFSHLDIFPIAIKYHWIVHSFPTNWKFCFHYILNIYVFRDKFQDSVFLFISASELCINMYCSLYVSFVTVGKNNKSIFYY